MSNPTTPIPPAQVQAFGRAACERLGIDPAIVSADDFHWEVVGDEDLGKVSLTAFLPADELLEMFNTAGLRA